MVVENVPSTPVEEAVLELTQRGYLRRLPVEQNGKKKSKKLEVPAAEDLILSVQAKTNQDVLVLTRTGKAFSLKVGDVPVTTGRNSKGTPLVTLLPASAQTDPDGIVATFVVEDYLDKMTVIMVSEQGRIKRIPLLELAGLSGRGLVVMKLKEDDSLVYAELAGAGGEVILATSGGRLLRFPLSEEQLPVMGRAAQGLQGLRLSNERLVGCAVVSPGSELLLVTQLGYAKRMLLKSIRTAKRGDIGTQAIRFGSKTDCLAGMVLVSSSEVMLFSSSDRLLRLPVGEVTPGVKDDAGSRLRILNAGEKVVSVRAIRLE